MGTLCAHRQNFEETSQFYNSLSESSLSFKHLQTTIVQSSTSIPTRFQYLQNLQNAILIRSYCRCSLRCRQRCHHHKWPSIIRWYPGRSCLEHHLGRCRRTSLSHFEDWRGQCFDYCQHHCFRSLWNPTPGLSRPLSPSLSMLSRSMIPPMSPTTVSASRSQEVQLLPRAVLPDLPHLLDLLPPHLPPPARTPQSPPPALHPPELEAPPPVELPQEPLLLPAPLDPALPAHHPTPTLAPASHPHWHSSSWPSQP